MVESAATRVISICSLDHSDVWRLTSSLLPEFVSADEFVVYVPEHQVRDFERITPAPISVLSQGTLGHDYRDELSRRTSRAGNEKRFGWYLQQFYKIEALLKSSEENLAIWDGDCVPTSPLELFSDFGQPMYMVAKEHHADYFDLTERVLGLPKSYQHSFVIPGFPIRRIWIEELSREISARHQGKPWFQVLLDEIDFQLGGGFSETETMGTWAAVNHPDSWTISTYNWERFGRSRFGPASRFTPDSLVELARRHELDIVSFENWDVSRNRRRIAALWGRITGGL